MPTGRPPITCLLLIWLCWGRFSASRFSWFNMWRGLRRLRRSTINSGHSATSTVKRLVVNQYAAGVALYHCQVLHDPRERHAPHELLCISPLRRPGVSLGGRDQSARSSSPPPNGGEQGRSAHRRRSAGRPRQLPERSTSSFRPQRQHLVRRSPRSGPQDLSLDRAGLDIVPVPDPGERLRAPPSDMSNHRLLHRGRPIVTITVTRPTAGRAGWPGPRTTSPGARPGRSPNVKIEYSTNVGGLHPTITASTAQ